MTFRRKKRIRNHTTGVKEKKKRFQVRLSKSREHLKPKRAVESVNSSLRLKPVSRRLALLASRNRRLVSLARAPELSANERGDDVHVVRGALAEVGRVSGGKGSLGAPVEALGEDDAGVGAGAEVEGIVLAGLDGLGGLTALEPEGPLAAGLGGLSGAGLALRLLVAALASTALEFTGVGGVGASVVLDRAGALQGGLEALESGPVGLERPVGVAGVDDLGGGATKGTSESLEVTAAAVLASDNGAGLA